MLQLDKEGQGTATIKSRQEFARYGDKSSLLVWSDEVSPREVPNKDAEDCKAAPRNSEGPDTSSHVQVAKAEKRETEVYQKDGQHRKTLVQGPSHAVQLPSSHGQGDVEQRERHGESGAGHPEVKRAFGDVDGGVVHVGIFQKADVVHQHRHEAPRCAHRYSLHDSCALAVAYKALEVVSVHHETAREHVKQPAKELLTCHCLEQDPPVDLSRRRNSPPDHRREYHRAHPPKRRNRRHDHQVRARKHKEQE
mmetsp:Transcript_6354/g.19203  ORF Transcript_6354/g.19203 Transcript_6354/m.19203 type:complete len:251 (-) Transcript_6354:157-909(-)